MFPQKESKQCSLSSDHGTLEMQLDVVESTEENID